MPAPATFQTPPTAIPEPPAFPTLMETQSPDAYLQAGFWDTWGIWIMIASIGKLEKSEAKVQTVRHIEEYFMYFLVTGAALTLLGLSLQVLKPAPAP